jgi:hypothetical protein
MTVVEINQKYRVKPVFSVAQKGKPRTMEGRVVYVHPEGRYAVLEFEGPKGKVRESFWPENLTDRNRMLEKRRGA